MPSQALADLETRLAEIDQLLEAHTALTKFYNAQQQLEEGSKDLKDILAVLEHLVKSPGPGRPPEVQALNKAGIALLSAHLQGYISDLFSEVVIHLFEGKVKSTQAMTATAPSRGNPNAENITRLFASIGFPSILDGISWQKMSNKSAREKLRELNTLRNDIVHGSPATVTKPKLKNFTAFVRNLTKRLDRKLRDHLQAVLEHNPWP
jgi:hypothetical protein